MKRNGRNTNMAGFYNLVLIGKTRALTLLVQVEGVTPANLAEAAREVASADIYKIAGPVKSQKLFSVNPAMDLERPSGALTIPDKYPGLYVW